MRQKPGLVFLSNEYIEDLLESHHTNLADLRIQKESAMFRVKESPSLSVRSTDYKSQRTPGKCCKQF